MGLTTIFLLHLMTWIHGLSKCCRFWISSTMLLWIFHCKWNMMVYYYLFLKILTTVTSLVFSKPVQFNFCTISYKKFHIQCISVLSFAYEDLGLNRPQYVSIAKHPKRPKIPPQTLKSSHTWNRSHSHFFVFSKNDP